MLDVLSVGNRRRVNDRKEAGQHRHMDQCTSAQCPRKDWSWKQLLGVLRTVHALSFRVPLPLRSAPMNSWPTVTWAYGNDR